MSELKYVFGPVPSRMHNTVKKVAAIHDLSGYGRASLTAIIPTLSSMGIQVCPLPTAILSNHTGGFETFSYLDLTDNMESYINLLTGILYHL